MSYFIYLVCPFLAWLITGISKFLINCIRSKRLAFDLIGYGGMPSNHSAIVSSTTCLIALKEGINHPAFAVAITLSFIVLLDASSLRMKIAEQAVLINQLVNQSTLEVKKPLRERIGHSKLEILAGVVLGAFIAYVMTLLF
ncbi:MAG: divergent PAP2 family protein [Saccharospirillaceae bacterium]|nr:divergent PAP2 family protein [Saccharospirillaceae bacterium]